MPERKIPERKVPERKSSAEEQPQQEGAQPKISRRAFLLGAGATAGGLVVGGAVGSQAFPKKVEVAKLPVASFYVGRDFTACTGCKLCQIACSKQKEGKLWPAASRIQLHEFLPGVEFPVLCYQCAEAAKCVEKCPEGALSVDPATNNTIVVDTTKCLRTAKNGECTICRDECPGQAVTFHPVSKAPLICDLCNGDPACTKVCPKGSLRNNGFKHAPAMPEAIAGGLQAMYKLPEIPPKQAMAPNFLAEADDTELMA